MADFCKQCSEETFGKDFGDLAGMPKYSVTLCEGCGPIQVDVDGSCISNDCIEKHALVS